MDVEKDTKALLQFIENHALKTEIVDMFRKGPPADTGWMWYSETPAFKAIEQEVVRLNYDSSGFAMMMRRIEEEFRLKEQRIEDPKKIRIYKLDEKNEKALRVLETEGSQAAVAHMMKAARCNYSIMRSMYG